MENLRIRWLNFDLKEDGLLDFGAEDGYLNRF